MIEKDHRIIGHISGEDLTEVNFLCDSIDENGNLQTVDLGELLIATDKITKERFLLRVTNVRYGQDRTWIRENARSHNLISTMDLKEEYEDFEQRFTDNHRNQLFLEAVCELVGFINHKKTFISPKRLPSYLSPVRRLANEDLDFMKNFLGDIPLGKMRSGSEILEMPVGFYSDLIPYHIGIFAQTGGGKSNTVLRFISSVLETEGEASMLIFEPHGEYLQTIKSHPLASTHMTIFSNKISAGVRQLKIAYSDLTVNDLLNIRRQMNWTEPQERFMREVEERLGRDWFRYLVDTPVDEDEMITLMEKTGLSYPATLKDEFRNTYLDTIKVVKSKINRIKRADYLVRESAASDLKEILSLLMRGHVVLIDMQSLQATEELLLSTILATKVLKVQKKAYNEDRGLFERTPPIAIVMEEAQRVLSKDANNDGNVFAQICNEGRKFKTGLMAITQQPKVMDPILLSQFNTLFILTLADSRDFEVLAGISKKPIDKLRHEIRTLAAGEAIVTSPKVPFALPIKVDLYEDHIKTLKEVHKPSSFSASAFSGII